MYIFADIQSENSKSTIQLQPTESYPLMDTLETPPLPSIPPPNLNPPPSKCVLCCYS